MSLLEEGIEIEAVVHVDVSVDQKRGWLLGLNHAGSVADALGVGEGMPGVQQDGES